MTDSVVERDGLKWWVPDNYLNLPIHGHEKSIRAWVRENIPRGGLFLDIGANAGTWAVTMADHFDEVVAVEPHPFNLAVLRKNIELNNLKNVRVEPIAAWCKDSQLHLNVTYASEHNYGSDIIATDLQLDRAQERLSVEARAIDSLGLAPAVIKIDVEGAELEVLEGAKRTLEAVHPIVLLEIHEGKGQYTSRRLVTSATVESVATHILNCVGLHMIELVDCIAVFRPLESR